MDEHRQLSQVGESGRNVKLSPSKENQGCSAASHLLHGLNLPGTGP